MRIIFFFLKRADFSLITTARQVRLPFILILRAGAVAKAPVRAGTHLPTEMNSPLIWILFELPISSLHGVHQKAGSSWSECTAERGKGHEEPLWMWLVGYTGVLMFTELYGPERTLQTPNGPAELSRSAKSRNYWRQLLFSAGHLEIHTCTQFFLVKSFNQCQPETF